MAMPAWAMFAVRFARCANLSRGGPQKPRRPSTSAPQALKVELCRTAFFALMSSLTRAYISVEATKRFHVPAVRLSAFPLFPILPKT